MIVNILLATGHVRATVAYLRRDPRNSRPSGRSYVGSRNERSVDASGQPNPISFEVRRNLKICVMSYVGPTEHQTLTHGGNEVLTGSPQYYAARKGLSILDRKGETEPNGRSC